MINLMEAMTVGPKFSGPTYKSRTKWKMLQGIYRVFHDFRALTAGGDFLGLCDGKSSYKHVSDFGQLRSYGHFLIPVHAFM